MNRDIGFEVEGIHVRKRTNFQNVNPAVLSTDAGGEDPLRTVTRKPEICLRRILHASFGCIRITLKIAVPKFSIVSLNSGSFSSYSSPKKTLMVVRSLENITDTGHRASPGPHKTKPDGKKRVVRIGVGVQPVDS